HLGTAIGKSGRGSPAAAASRSDGAPCHVAHLGILRRSRGRDAGLSDCHSTSGMHRLGGLHSEPRQGGAVVGGVAVLLGGLPQRLVALAAAFEALDRDDCGPRRGGSPAAAGISAINKHSGHVVAPSLPEKEGMVSPWLWKRRKPPAIDG